MDLTSDQYIYIAFSCMDKLEKHAKNRIEGDVELLNCDGLKIKLDAS
jgi:hypothetical protein